jgi:hypothetical protein
LKKRETETGSEEPEEDESGEEEDK